MAEDFEKLGQETVVANKARCADGAGAVVMIAPLVSHAAAVAPDPHTGIVDVSRGAMKGVLLIGGSVPDTAVKLIEKLPDMTLTTRVGPENLMTWVMEGIAGAMPMAGREAREAIAARIEEKFMGASTIFEGLCVEAEKKAASGAP